MTRTRLATSDDAEIVASMLHDFNVEFDTPTPGVEFLVGRCRTLLDAGDMTVVLGGDALRQAQDPPLGLGVLRFWPALWSDGFVAYLEELYVVPDRRDQGIGGAIMATAMDLARSLGGVEMYIGVDEPDVDTRRFYERLGFRNHDPDDPSARMFFYEREL
ncbi:GNAT family N-acetyltransferase [Aeromicrobium sp.]|uniref:GNAT family N-acetyltransferase n=1 Tax=Aeromicrobium sp. TaxID=1871063 RepID=UPI003D6C04BA